MGYRPISVLCSADSAFMLHTPTSDHWKAYGALGDKLLIILVTTWQREPGLSVRAEICDDGFEYMGYRPIKRLVLC